MNLPLITQVHGAAVGVGASLALLDDIIVAGESTNFIQAFCKVGLVPDGGATFILTRAIGRVRAFELILLGEKLPAAKALEWGLITRVVPDKQLADAVSMLASELARTATQALVGIRRMTWRALDGSFDEQLDRECELQRDVACTDDFREGVAAFLEKRPAQFVGR